MAMQSPIEKTHVEIYIQSFLVYQLYK
jgi:hypothetical protein